MHGTRIGKTDLNWPGKTEEVEAGIGIEPIFTDLQSGA